MKREDDESLWDLLGRGARPDISPFFARNVVRQVRENPHSWAFWRSWLAPRWLVPASGLAAVLLAGILFIHGTGSRSTNDSDQDVIAKIDAQDYEVVADLDELLASDENNPWDDNSSL
jgi:hypothetical protein